MVPNNSMNSRVLLLVLFALGGCSDPSAPATGTTVPTGSASTSLTSASASASAAPSLASNAAADIEPVYPRVAPTNATAERICKTLHQLPSQRVGECCEGKPSTAFLGECTRTLSYAIDSGALRVEDAAVTACEAAQDKALEGCAWVHSSLPPPPPECRSLLVGTLARGAACRSALECKEGDSCLGLSATTIGICGEPKSTTGMCQTGIDTLAAYTFADLEKNHPDCKGICDKLRCRDLTPIGSACVTHPECGATNHCEAGTCREGAPPSKGDACSDKLTCHSSLRCIGGECGVAGREGEPCKTNGDCLGTCSDGVCKRVCIGAVKRPGSTAK